MVMSDGLWIFALLVFFTVVLLLQGTVVPVFSDSRKTSKRIQARLQKLADASGGPEFTSLLREKYLRNLSSYERTLESMPGMERLARILEQAGLQTPAYRVVLLAFILSVAGAVVSWIMSRWWLIALVSAVAGFGSPFLYVLNARAKRFARFEEQMPDAIDMIQRALKAGHPFGQCLKLVGEDMSEPICKEFELTFADLSYGNDPRRALFGLLQRVPSVSVTALITAVIVQRETGGNLAENLAKISSVIRGRFRFQRRVKTLSAEGRLSGVILAMTPIVLFGVLWAMHPEYVAILTKHPMGSTLISIAVAMGTIGILWIRTLVRIEV
jgi:tight adherence protein B